MITSNRYIDNTKTIYIPIRLQCGVTIQCTPEIIHQCPSIIQTLELDVSNCIRTLPPSVHNFIKRIKIWVNVNYFYGAIDDPRVLKHTTAHHHRQWLETVNDLPQKALGVEIYNCCEYERSRQHWNGCGLLLHEFCHLIHQCVVQDGLENEMVIGAFGKALESGLYDDVLRRDWAFCLEGEDRDAAYATINHKEFFSELSVAFLSRGYDACLSSSGSDFNLVTKMEDCSPPMMSPEVIERMRRGNHILHAPRYSGNLLIQFFILITSRSDKGHCNKFYPFTHAQMKSFDPCTYVIFQKIWCEIAEWRDPTLQDGIEFNCQGCLGFSTWGKSFTKKKTNLLTDGMKNENSFVGSSSLDEATDAMSDQDESAEDLHSYQTSPPSN